MPGSLPEMGIGQIAASNLLRGSLSIEETVQNEMPEKTTRAYLKADKE